MSSVNRLKNAKRNISSGIFNKLITLGVPFLARSILLRIMGAEYLGLNSLFTSILSVLSLAELGIDTAITFNMYKPIADNDTYVVCAFLQLYKKLYRIIGSIIIVCGILFVPFIKFMIKGNAPSDVNIIVLFFIYLANTALSYYLWAYKKSLLIALQRNDYVSNVMTGIVLVQNVAQVIVFAIFRNYYVYILVLPLCTVLSNIICNYISNKNFPEYQAHGKLDKVYKERIKKQVGGLMISKLSMQSRNAFDNIVVSSLIGLTAVTVYSNYYFVINAAHLLLSSVLSSSTSSIGNSVVTETKEKNLKDFYKINLLYMWLSIWGLSCLIVVYQDFMEIWAGARLLLPSASMLIFVIYAFLLFMGDIKGTYVDTSGIWWQNRYNSVIQTIINLVCNFAFGYMWGINGIIIASIASVVFSNVIYGPYILFKHYFGIRYLRRYLYECIKFVLIFAIICLADQYVNNYVCIYGILGCVLKILIASLVANFCMILAYFKTENMRESVKLLKGLLRI